MTEISEKSAITRKSNRVLILFAIFAICLVGAWWMVRHRGAALVEGKNIITEMRQKKLEAFWGPEDSTQWFLIRNGGKNVGWQVQYRKPHPEGGFEGGDMRILLSSQGPRRMTSRWILNNEITRGAYGSDVSTLGQLNTRLGTWMLKKPLYGAKINLDEGKLYVIQKIHGGDYSSQADEPDGYIPEGTMDLVCYLVAKKKTKAKFRIILDSQPPSKKGTTFATIGIRYSDVKPLSPGGSAAIISIAGQESLCFFDKTGKVEKQTDGETEDVTATEAEILKAFPEAVTMLKNFKR